MGPLIGQAPRYLADTSALVHMRFHPVRELLTPLIVRGLVACCGPIDLEILFTARSADDLESLVAERELAYPLIPTIQGDFERAAEVMILLARVGKHRSAKLPDLLIAAVAERSGLVLLHYDADFEHISGVTGQQTQWVAQPGSLAS